MSTEFPASTTISTYFQLDAAARCWRPRCNSLRPEAASWRHARPTVKAPSIATREGHSVMRHPSPPDEDASSRSRTASLVRTDFDDTLSVVPSHAPGPHITAIEPLALLRSSFEYMLRMLVPEARVTTYESVEAYDGAPTQFVLLGLQPRQYK